MVPVGVEIHRQTEAKVGALVLRAQFNSMQDGVHSLHWKSLGVGVLQRHVDGLLHRTRLIRRNALQANGEQTLLGELLHAAEGRVVRAEAAVDEGLVEGRTGSVGEQRAQYGQRKVLMCVSERLEHVRHAEGGLLVGKGRQWIILAAQLVVHCRLPASLLIDETTLCQFAVLLKVANHLVNRLQVLLQGKVTIGEKARIAWVVVLSVKVLQLFVAQ